jgi:hypothetical protein
MAPREFAAAGGLMMKRREFIMLVGNATGWPTETLNDSIFLPTTPTA